MNIAIVGVGMGGLTAACLLADRGHDITVFDRFAHPAPVGSGLVIQPVGQAVLAEAGALDAALAAGDRVTRMLGRKAGSAARVLDVRYDLNDPSAFGLALHRAALFDALWQAVPRRPAVTVVSGTRIMDAAQTPADIVLGDATGMRHGPFDLALDSSGAGSALSPLKA